MLQSVTTIPFPDWLANIDCEVRLHQEGISEDGEPIENVVLNRKCIFSEKSKRIITEDGKSIELIGTIYIKGDIAPDLNTISDGIVIIDGRQMEIYSGARPRNPNGAVHHTKLQVK